MKYIKIVLLLSVVFVFGFIALNPMDNYILKLRSNELDRFPEKTYIHTDKPFYTVKDTIWFKNYLANGITHTQTSKSNVVYVEFISPKDSILFKEKFYVPNKAFGSAGEIPIDASWESGEYQLRSYTNYMRNADEKYFFKKSVTIKKFEAPKETVSFVDTEKFNVEAPILKADSKKVSKINLKFFPEGGTVLANVSNKFGIKSVDEKGTGVKITGSIKIKGSGELITLFRTYDYGLGNISFVPKAGVKYEAEIELNGSVVKYPIDTTVSNGVQLGVTNSGKNILLKATTGAENLKGYFIIGHLRGKLFFNKEVISESNAVQYNLITNELPNGVVHFTLFDPTGKPKAERLVFIDNPKRSSEATINIDKSKFSKRDKVSYKVSILNANKNIRSANLSMSVTNKSLVPLSIRENIKSWMLLNSDLRGEIPNAAVFFDPEKSINQRRFLLESLMLTHGWRRFKWEELAKNKFKNPEFRTEKGLRISGKSLASDPALIGKDVENTLMLLSSGKTFFDKKTTKVNNQFDFDIITFSKDVQGAIQAKAVGVEAKKARKLKVVLEKELASPKITPLTKAQSDKEILYLNNYEKVSQYIDQLNFTFDGANQLGELIIEGKKAEDEKEKEIKDLVKDLAPISYVPRNRFAGEDLEGLGALSIFDVISGISGVTDPRQGNIDENGEVIDESNRDTVYLLNGIETSPDDLISILVDNVEVIDILKGIDATLYRALTVVAVYLKRGVSPNETVQDAPGIANFTVSPFYKAKKFYSKNYLTESEIKDFNPDYRTTLHWNPNVNTFRSKVVDYSFYTGDQTGIFQFELEGITEDGELIYATAEIEVVE